MTIIIIIIIMITPLQGPSHGPFKVCAPWPVMQACSSRSKVKGYQGQLQCGLSLTAFDQKDRTAGRLRLREGGATLKVTQHSSSIQN